MGFRVWGVWGRGFGLSGLGFRAEGAHLARRDPSETKSQLRGVLAFSLSSHLGPLGGGCEPRVRVEG